MQPLPLPLPFLTMLWRAWPDMRLHGRKARDV